MQTQINSNEIMAVAKAYRSERSSLKQAKIMEQAIIDGVSMTALISALDTLVNPDTTISEYKNKAEKITGLIIHGKEFSHRGLYLPFKVIENFDLVTQLVNDWKASPTCKY